MRATMEDWNNGWFGIDLGIAEKEIDDLIGLLQMLKAEPEQHFHISSDYEGKGGIGEITIRVQVATEGSNVRLSGHALLPGEEI